MIKSFNTKIIFSRALSRQEQFAFWSHALTSVKKLVVSGQTHFSSTIDWNIDYSDSNLNEFEAKKRFAIFLEKQQDLIKDFTFYKASENKIAV